jgi:hypothetical protein
MWREIRMTFTGFRWDDTTVQKGVTYYYQVYAKVTSGMLCPGANAKIP